MDIPVFPAELTELTPPRPTPKPSRIRQYVEEQAAKSPSEDEIADLESQLDESERRNLRLNQELLNETVQRIRLEKIRDQISEELEDLTDQLSEADQKLEKVGKPQRIGKRKPRAKPEKIGESTPEPPAVRVNNEISSRKSARTRGGVK